MIPAVVWDRYWRRRIAEIREEYYFASGFPPCDALPLFQSLLGDRLRRVLLAGSGLDLEPYHYAHLGYDVTAVDFSRVALEWVRSVGERRDIEAWFYEQYRDSLEDGVVWKRMDLEASRAAAAVERVEGGSVELVVHDLFAYEPAEPFDAIRMSQGFAQRPEAEQRSLAARAYEWTAPGGIWWCAIWGSERRVNYEAWIQQAVREAGFFPYLSEWYAWFWAVWPEWIETRDRDGRFHEESLARRTAELAEHRRRLQTGEKLAVCLHTAQIFPLP